MAKIFKGLIKIIGTAYLCIVFTVSILDAGVTYASAENSVSTDETSDDVKYVVQKAVITGDNKDKPFIVLDKKKARLYVYDRTGILIGDAPVLLGLAVGDEIAPEIARRPLSKIGPSDRITPAGRYYAVTGGSSYGVKVLWVDYYSRLAIHPVATGVPSQRRLQRLNSETTKDNRISWGCINIL
jgi:hypothetical protein